MAVGAASRHHHGVGDRRLFVERDGDDLLGLGVIELCQDRIERRGWLRLGFRRLLAARLPGLLRLGRGRQEFGGNFGKRCGRCGCLCLGCRPELRLRVLRLHPGAGLGRWFLRRGSGGGALRLRRRLAGSGLLRWCFQWTGPRFCERNGITSRLAPSPWTTHLQGKVFSCCVQVPPAHAARRSTLAKGLRPSHTVMARLISRSPSISIEPLSISSESLVIPIQTDVMA